jgi:thiamine-phosphate pyrophosphorylase
MAIVARPACQTGPVTPRHERLASARLYLVCGDQSDAFLQAALRGGVDIVQLRMKDSADEEILDAACRFKRICDAAGALLIVNDRPDLAAAADADGVHLGQDDTPVQRARQTLGPGRLIGLSTHTPDQIEAATTAGVDYIGVGPVNETPTKPGRPAVGLDLVDYAASHATLPFFAIGGIAPANIAQVRAAGGTRVAVVRALTETADPEVTARELRDALTEAGVGAA